MEIFDNPYIFGRHRNKCDKKPVKFDDRLKELSQKRNELLQKAKPKPEYASNEKKSKVYRETQKG